MVTGCIINYARGSSGTCCSRFTGIPIKNFKQGHPKECEQLGGTLALVTPLSPLEMDLGYIRRTCGNPEMGKKQLDSRGNVQRREPRSTLGYRVPSKSSTI